jgi:cytochrome c
MLPWREAYHATSAISRRRAKFLVTLTIRSKRALLTVLAVSAAVAAAHLRYDTMCVPPDDAQRGRAWARTCQACHDIIEYPHYPSPYASGGPNLQYVYMSLAGTRPQSNGRDRHPPLIAAREAGIVWTEENLLNYLRDPKGFLESATGTSFNPVFYMSFFIGDERSRRDVVSYLRAIKINPRCD